MTEIDRLEALTSSELGNLFEAAQLSDVDQALSILKLIANRAQANQDYESMATWNQRLAEFAEENLRMDIAADAWRLTGLSHFLQDNESLALHHFEIAESINETLGRDPEILECLMNQIDCYECLENHQKVIQISERALNIARISQNFWLAGQICLKMAKSHYESEENISANLNYENYRTAYQYAELAINYFTNSGDSEKIVEAFASIVDILAITNKNSEALEYIENSINLLHNSGNDQNLKFKNLSMMFLMKGVLLIQQDQFQESIEAIERAILIESKLSIENRQDRFSSLLHRYLGQAHMCLEQNVEALKELNSAAHYAKSANDSELFYRILEKQALILLGEDDFLGSLELAKKCLLEYEDKNLDSYPSYIYVRFIIIASDCLEYLERWSELLDTLTKIAHVDDFLISLEDVIHLDRSKALSLWQLDQNDQALTILDMILEESTDDLLNEDLAECFEMRGKIRFSNSAPEAISDIEMAIKLYNLVGCYSRAQFLKSEFNL